MKQEFLAEYVKYTRVLKAVGSINILQLALLLLLLLLLLPPSLPPPPLPLPPLRQN